MGMPSVVQRTFNTFKDEASFRKLIKQMRKKVSKFRGRVGAAFYVHKKVDEELSKLFQDEIVGNLVQCKVGCSACCHSQVSVSTEEAELLAQKISSGHPINWSLLYTQAKAGNSSREYFKIPYPMRACIFLSDKGSCTVYEDRPSVCRTNYVVSDPIQCQIKGDGIPKVDLLNTFGADAWIYAQFKESKEAGTLPMMIKKALEKNIESQLNSQNTFLEKE